MTKIPGYLAFSIVCFLNIVSDCLSDYRGGLQLPIMQKNIPSEDLMEAYSFNQLLSMVCSISGQALGVWLLAISHQNFAMVASINAVTFLLSSTCLLMRKKQLTHAPVIEPKSKKSLVHDCQEMYQNAKSILQMRRFTTLASCSSHWFSSMPLGIHLQVSTICNCFTLPSFS